MQFAVRTLGPLDEGVKTTVIEAASRAEAMLRMRDSSLVVLGATPLPTPKVLHTATAGSASGLDVSWWCQELRTLLAAGMTVVEALETLNAQALGAPRAAVHMDLIERLRRGEALSTAMAASREFPAILIAGVKASERTSTLIQALDEYITYHRMIEKLKKQVVSAAIYPSLVAGLGSLIAVFLLMFVIPRFARMYSELSGSLGFATKVLVGASNLLNNHSALVLTAVTGGALWVAYAWRAGTLMRGALACLELVPVLRRHIQEFRLAKLFQSLSLMTRGGFALDDALLQCAGLELGADTRQRVLAAHAELLKGRKVSDAFEDARLTDAVTRRLITVGERTGNFDQILQTIAERHASTFATFIERATRIVEPAMLLTVSLAVGTLIVLMYMPIFDIAGSVH